MEQVLRQKKFRITINHAFEQVIRSCGASPRKGQTGTWINNELIDAYHKLHHQGYAHSVEAWQDDMLAGGLYGVQLGRVFFGESMFSLVANASKAAFITFVRKALRQGFQLVDCQIYTAHLASLGAGFISGPEFQEILRTGVSGTPREISFS
jgi:leucyl/phenylalanyl-tRNA--protein transferase